MPVLASKYQTSLTTAPTGLANADPIIVNYLNYLDGKGIHIDTVEQMDKSLMLADLIGDEAYFRYLIDYIFVNIDRFDTYVFLNPALGYSEAFIDKVFLHYPYDHLLFEHVKNPSFMRRWLEHNRDVVVNTGRLGISHINKPVALPGGYIALCNYTVRDHHLRGKSVVFVGEPGHENNFATIEEYYPGGQVNVRDQYMNGKSHGTEVHYWPNGQIMRVNYSEHGEMLRLEQSWAEDGTPLRDNVRQTPVEALRYSDLQVSVSQLVDEGLLEV